MSMPPVKSTTFLNMALNVGMNKKKLLSLLE